MRPSTSLFLDGLRVAAALTVFAHHCVLILYSGAIWVPGHEAVVVFFVLSGYVITNATLNRPGLRAADYIIARLCRLYSVIIPALLLTALTVLIGHLINPNFYAHIIRDRDSFRYLATALCLQSIWWWNLTPTANGPFWSLGYEFWYYVLFGIAIFVRNWKWKIPALAACSLLVGINVLLLLPIWVAGAILCFYRDKFSIPRPTAILIFIGALLAATLVMIGLPDYPSAPGRPPFFYSAAFLKDWLFGLGVAAIIGSFDQAWGLIPLARRWETPVRWAAAHTFSLYLFHYPLILFAQALGIFNPHLWWSAVLEISLILAVIILLSEFTETKRKQVQKFVTHRS